MPTGTDRTLAALINLLDEPDEGAFSRIRDQILLAGAPAIPALEKNLEDSFNELIRERSKQIIRRLSLENIHHELRNWSATGGADLLQGFMLVTRTGSPEINETDILTRIEQLRLDIWLELHDQLTALENIRVINHVFFEVHKFQGNRDDLADPRYHYLDHMLGTRKGSPISLAILYLIIARKLGLPVYGVNLPQHFVLAYLNNNHIARPGEEDVLFYINPFNRGTVFTRREIDAFVSQLKIRPEPAFFAPCSHADIIRRLIAHLIFAHNHTGNDEAVTDHEYIITALE